MNVRFRENRRTAQGRFHPTSPRNKTNRAPPGFPAINPILALLSPDKPPRQILQIGALAALHDAQHGRDGLGLLECQQAAHDFVLDKARHDQLRFPLDGRGEKVGIDVAGNVRKPAAGIDDVHPRSAGGNQTASGSGSQPPGQVALSGSLGRSVLMPEQMPRNAVTGSSGRMTTQPCSMRKLSVAPRRFTIFKSLHDYQDVPKMTPNVRGSKSIPAKTRMDGRSSEGMPEEPHG